MDAIDRVVEQWAKEKPELETEPMAMMGRIMRIAKYMETQVAELHKKYDMKLGEFDVLATLRRSGKPYRLTPSELIGSMMLTSGAMTNRLDKLEAKGLISREHSKEDRRSVSVQLTKDGKVKRMYAMKIEDFSAQSLQYIFVRYHLIFHLVLQTKKQVHLH